MARCLLWHSGTSNTNRFEKILDHLGGDTNNQKSKLNRVMIVNPECKTQNCLEKDGNVSKK